MSVHVTEHAIDRYIERVAAVDRATAYSDIVAAEPAIEFAAAFGAHTVRLGSGGKLVIRGVSNIRVVTVLPREWINRADMPRAGVVLCGLCGLRSGHPIARACTRVECPLAHGAQAECACTEWDPCVPDSCSWVEYDLCSACDAVPS